MAKFSFENTDNLFFEHLGVQFKLEDRQESHLGGNADQHLRQIQLKVKGRKTNGAEGRIYAVAKLLPGTHSGRDMCLEKAGLRKEIYFFKNIAPRLIEFQKEFKTGKLTVTWPEYIGSRFGLNGEKELSSHAALLVKNLLQTGKL